MSFFTPWKIHTVIFCGEADRLRLLFSCLLIITILPLIAKTWVQLSCFHAFVLIHERIMQAFEKNPF